MKLTYLSTARIPDEWAHVVQILTMCDAFVQAGAEVTLIAPLRAATPNEDPFAFAGVPASFSIWKLPCLDLFPGTQNRTLYWVRSVSYLFFLVPYLLFAKSTAVYTRDPLLVFAARLAAKKVVWEIHTAERNWFARYAAANASRIVTISQGLHDFCRTLGVPEERIRVENDGVTLEAFEGLPSREALRSQYDLSTKAKVIAYVGKYKTMGEAKGVEGLIEAVAHIAHEMPEVLLMIVGLYPNEIPEVESRVRLAGLTRSQYTLIAHVPKTEVPKYLRASDVLVMNYPNTPHYSRIMSPLKMYEYMASGVPIVSSDLLTIREALTDKSACLVSPDEPSELAAGIVRVLEDAEYAGRIAEQAVHDVKDHTWKSRATRILKWI